MATILYKQDALTINSMRRALVGALFLSLAAVPSWAAKAPFTFDAMMRLTRIDDPQLSPDAKLVAFTGVTVDMASQHEAKPDLRRAVGRRGAGAHHHR